MYAVLSDIHGNMYALEQVAQDMSGFDIEGIILLGDLIDYGMQSNEVVGYIQNHLNKNIVCNIWGNHEKAILNDNYSGFSSPRGVECAKYTSSVLRRETIDYLNTQLLHEGMHEFKLNNKKIFAVHGSMEDAYWKAISPENVRGVYFDFDIVLSGHSHIPHVFYKMYEANDPEYRNKHAVLFINPGSVGQPRNHIPFAQYVLLDAEKMSAEIRAVEYDIVSAMKLYDCKIDCFYKNRLKKGV